MSFRESAGLPPSLSLHRYWMHANRMRMCFEEALTKNPPPIPSGGQSDVADTSMAAVKYAADDRGMFMSYWYGALYVVIEGWKALRLTDPAIDPLIISSNVKLLRNYRNGVFHFQRNYFDMRFAGFFMSKDSVNWVRQIHSELGMYFLRKHSETNSRTT